MKGNRTAATKPYFSPETGLMPSGSVKDQLQNLLNQGFFDKVDTCIIGLATADSYNTMHLGRVWDCLALDSILHEELLNQLKG